MFTNQQIVSFFFKPVLDEQDEPVIAYFRCRCSTVRQQAPKTGYSNLIQHVRKQHPDFEELMRTATIAETGTLAPWVRQRSLNLFGWLHWTIMCGLPLHFCENAETRRYTKLDPISQEQLLDGMERVTLAVEASIASEMPDKYGLLIDGWSNRSEHFLAVFGCYEVDGVRHQPLLAMHPLINSPDGDHSAPSHATFLREMLARDYNKSLDDCLFLVGDNCSVNKRLASELGVPLVGCASHRLNLAVQSMLSDYSHELGQVKELMIKLKTLNLSAKLRFKTRLRPVLSQATRWGSTFAMVDRYLELLDLIVDFDELQDLLPAPATNRRLRNLLDDLKKVESVSYELQSESVTLLDARVYFDALIEFRTEFADYLGPRATIMHSPAFEGACVKVLDGRTSALSRSEKATLARFAVSSPVQAMAASTGPAMGSQKKPSFVEQVKKKRKTGASATRYELLGSIPPTSNVVERLFSVAKATLGTQRQSLLPITLEMILFLRANKNYWDATVVNACS